MTRPITILEAARTHCTPAQVWRLLGTSATSIGGQVSWRAAVVIRLRWAWVRAARARWPKPLMGRTETTEELTDYIGGAALPTGSPGGPDRSGSPKAAGL